MMAMTRGARGSEHPRLSRRRLPVLSETSLPTDHERPHTRGECADVPRPCPFVGCRHHLYLDVLPSGRIRYPRHDREPWHMPAAESCTLDVADEGPQRRLTVARLLGLVPERVRQVHDGALAVLSLEHGAGLSALFELAGEPSRSAPLADRLEALSDSAPARAMCRPQDREARAQRRLEAWTNDVVALLRAGVSLREAWARANAGGEP